MVDLLRCRNCGYEVSSSDALCPNCRVLLNRSSPVAVSLAVILSPVGLWYRDRWAAGFAWLAVVVVAGLHIGAWAALLAWIGMVVHGGVAANARRPAFELTSARIVETRTTRSL